MPLSRGERFEEARRKANKTMDDVAAETGLSKSSIQALEDDDNDRDVGYTKIAKLAACYGVSADYLMGLTDIASQDYSIRDFCKKTGLTEAAVTKIISMDGINPGRRIEAMNALLEAGIEKSGTDLFSYMLLEISDFLYEARQGDYEGVFNNLNSDSSDGIQGERGYVIEAAREAGLVVMTHKEAAEHHIFRAVSLFSQLLNEMLEKEYAGMHPEI